MSYKIKFEVEGYQCLRCGHKWIPRIMTDTEPTICPKCKSPYWNKPRKIALSKSTPEVTKERKSLRKEFKDIEQGKK